MCIYIHICTYGAYVYTYCINAGMHIVAIVNNMYIASCILLAKYFSKNKFTSWQFLNCV